MPGGNRALEPPDPISNSEVKRCIADDSVGSPHVKVGHYQALNSKGCIQRVQPFFMQKKKQCNIDVVHIFFYIVFYKKTML